MFSSPASSNKLFVGNLPSDLAHAELTNYFEQYGKLQDCVIIMDKVTGKSRGFAFVTFEDEQDVDNVMSKTHILHGREIDCKKAAFNSSQPAKPKEVIEKTNRIKIANLSLIITDEEFKEYFGQFGKIDSFERINDPITGEFQGHAEIIFENEEAVESIMKQLNELKIGGRTVLCSKAPKSALKQTERED